MSTDEDPSLKQIRRAASSMRRARARPDYKPLLGLGVFGVIGWSIAIPTVAGALLGFWLDRKMPQGFSWTLALILAGLVIGILVAWEWLAAQQNAANEQDPTDSQTLRGPP